MKQFSLFLNILLLAAVGVLFYFHFTDNKNTETTLQMAQSIDEKRQIFKEEMKYLNSVQRGMPKYGEPKRRIDNANSNKIEQMMQSTQGLGLGIYQRRNLHGVM